MSLADILAKKRAATASEPKPLEEAPPKESEVSVIPFKEAQTPVASPPAESKPLTFAEKLALKRKEAESLVATAAKVEVQPFAAPSQDIDSEQTYHESLPGLDEEGETDKDLSDGDRQAFADIKAKIKLLSQTPDGNLSGAMTELKSALRNNPQACYLMLPQHIGEMVLALYRIKGESIQKQTEKRAKGPGKAKNVPLSAADIQAAFDELD